MTDPALITSLGTLAVVLLSAAGLWLKVSRTVGSNGGATLHQVVARIDKRQRDHGERLARVETSVQHLLDNKRG